MFDTLVICSRRWSDFRSFGHIFEALPMGAVLAKRSDGRTDGQIDGPWFITYNHGYNRGYIHSYSHGYEHSYNHGCNYSSVRADE